MCVLDLPDFRFFQPSPQSADRTEFLDFSSNFKINFQSANVHRSFLTPPPSPFMVFQILLEQYFQRKRLQLTVLEKLVSLRRGCPHPFFLFAHIPCCFVLTSQTSPHCSVSHNCIIWAHSYNPKFFQSHSLSIGNSSSPVLIVQVLLHCVCIFSSPELPLLLFRQTLQQHIFVRFRQFYLSFSTFSVSRLQFSHLASFVSAYLNKDH